MKKLTQKLAYLLFTVVFFVAVSSVSSVFAADKTMGITLRIEGIDNNLFNATEEVPYTTDSLTLQQALIYIDNQEDSIKITGVDTSYITDINGESAGKFGGWDGWLYKVNGKEVVVGIDGLTLAEGDSVLLYYGDPYGVGMQFPVADTTDIAEGVITFTSSDTTYDANYNPVITVNPVNGASVIWSYGDTTKEYVTDESGSIQIEEKQLAEGDHAVQIIKTADSGLPLVLRFAPGYTISVEATTDSSVVDNATDDNDPAVVADVSNVVEAPKTGEQIATTIIFLVLAIAALCGVIFFRRKEKNEK